MGSTGAPPARESRWSLLRAFVLPPATRSSAAADGDGDGDGADPATAPLTGLSRRPGGRYKLVPLRVRDGEAAAAAADVVVEYVVRRARDERIELTLRQRREGALELRDIAACGENSIDSTGLVCLWPAEEVLTYFCATHPELFRNKTVVELGSGYGLGGLAIAACADAAEVVITDGNPQVLDYIEHNIEANSRAFGDTSVSSAALYWSREQTPFAGRAFDLVVAADCTFFTDFHVDLACTIKSLLGTSSSSRAILFNPRRGNTLDLFVKVAESHGLIVEMEEHYDSEVWDIHQRLMEGDHTGWPNYDSNHCYPIFLSLRASVGA